jgi:hypothetical protein
MIKHIRFVWQLLVLSAIFLLLGFLILPKTNIDLSLQIYAITLLAITLINFITFTLMAIGTHKPSKEGMVWVMGGIGLKFLLYLAFILTVWGITKNLSKGFIVTFFALYLVFTFFLAANLLKILKNK